MDDISRKQLEEEGLRGGGEDSRYIKYRHALQLNAGGHTHTLEVEVPVVIGTNDETRAQLLREAEVGMSQLADQIRRRFSSGAQREIGTQHAQQPSVPVPNAPTKPISRPAAAPAPQTTAQSVQPVQSSAMRSPERPTSAKKEVVVPPTRPSVGASMPGATLSTNNVDEVVSIADFVKYIKENFNLLPNQAMSLLGVKTLSGLNLRDELRRLQTLVAQPSTPTAETPNAAEDNAKPARNEPPTNNSSSHPKKAEPLDELAEERMTVREERPVYIFDEEVGPDDEDEVDDELEDLEDEESGLSPAMQSMAEDILKKLRELRGATTVSPSRIQVLNNVVVSQIGNEHLQELIDGVWGVTSPRKLKVDQVEELISWAKTEDDFVTQVDALLVLIEEERYARGNR
ncbi:hypothetical protein KSF_026850 [Reticulibacter mediterranei]|uniref:Uncharacterized protein n=1 Tax=Reticulibacter mediterranei TaxID=2778369 RepID=A0A8J3IJV3_9CHLR|nr:hypothetical protein [Reticulibacter mediterranei]GHO92637.1 hypothetical protein KSF_026850 [Reticulibacter mediterranei]